MPTIFKTHGWNTTATRWSVEEIVDTIRNKKYLKEVAEFREMGALANVKKRENGTLDIEDAAIRRLSFSNVVCKHNLVLILTGH